MQTFMVPTPFANVLRAEARDRSAKASVEIDAGLVTQQI
jgi:hypothetical protein